MTTHSVPTKTALLIGGSRGLGQSLVHSLLSRGYKVYTTIRSSSPSLELEAANLEIITGVDLAKEDVGAVVQHGVGDAKFDLVIFSAGLFEKDTLDTISSPSTLAMLTICALAPLHILSSLSSHASFAPKATVLIVSSEGGSIALIGEGGNYGHHASKAAQNMVAKILSVDLKERNGVTTVVVHPGFMRTEMTRNVGYSEYWESGGAVLPSVAADSLLDFADTITPELNGQFWAPRGPRDIGQAERVMGKDLPTPLQLPW